MSAKPGGEGQGTLTNKTDDPLAESPSEKLRDETPPGELVAGAQNPESAEVKKEINPNTE
jgi:hypothetical protein